MRKTKQKAPMLRGSQSDPSTRIMILSFLTHQPEFPHKIILATAGPAYFDWPTLFPGPLQV